MLATGFPRRCEDAQAPAKPRDEATSRPIPDETRIRPVSSLPARQCNYGHDLRLQLLKSQRLRCSLPSEIVQGVASPEHRVKRRVSPGALDAHAVGRQHRLRGDGALHGGHLLSLGGAELGFSQRRPEVPALTILPHWPPLHFVFSVVPV